MGLTTSSHKTTIVEKPNNSSRPDPKIRQPKLWKRIATWNVRTLLENNGYKKIRRWRLIAKDRTEWAGIIREAKALQGL
jgi:hypothetical protein